MFLSPETITALIDLGAPAEKLAAVLHMIERDAEAVAPRRSTGAERQARYEARKRQKASASVSERQETSENVSTDASLSLPPSPQTPQPPTHTREIYTPRARPVRRVDVARGFEAFWAAYPKRKAKDAAAKAFAKAIARIDDPDPLAVILAGIERALPGWDDPQFIPHPASWLNAGRWADDAPEPRNLNSPRPRNDQPSRPSKSDHLAGIFGAMGVADRYRADDGSDPPEPRHGGGMRALPPAA